MQTPTDKTILNILKKGDKKVYHSGESLSRSLGLSRTAIWKHIRKLRDSGYRIEARPSQGYRLECLHIPFNKPELTAGLETLVMGRPLHFYRDVESTNYIASELAQNGAPEGTCVIADYQKRGKGRMGRAWESPPGVNLYLSLILRPALSPVDAPRLTFLAANAVIETIKKTLPSLHPEIKWPNDILINDKKTAGILTEMNSEVDRINFVILGIGINLNMTDRVFPENIRSVATSIRLETGEEVDRVRFAGLLLLEIEKEYNIIKRGGFTSILDHWKRYSNINGRRARIKQADGKEIEGVVLGVDEDGVLCLKKDDGGVVKVFSGDLML
ncbi:MAG: biotin--[acetyl-CoA-carboxylase] ligase [Thermodesulfobacteriota bacterium]